MINFFELRNIATYDSEGVQIRDLKKVNLFYGANGSGKTTISNFLQNIGDEKFKNCSVQWKNAVQIKTLVYNKEFRERNFGKGRLNGVFTLGQATAEQKKVIEEKLAELTQLREDGVRKKDTLNSQIVKRDALEKKFANAAWRELYKKYEGDFKEAFAGSMKSGEAFKSRLLQEFKENKSELSPIDALREKANTIFGERPEIIDSVNEIQFQRIIEIEKSPIWEKIIIGKADVDIARLIQKLSISDWVNQGRAFLQDSDTCPFCQQQTITDAFKEQVEAFFDQDYSNDIKLLKNLAQEYKSMTQNVINELNQIESLQKNLKNSKLNIDKFGAYLRTLISQVAGNNELLSSKLKEPSRSIDLISLLEQFELLEQLIGQANAEIQKHNKIVHNYGNERSNLIKSIWRFITDEYKVDIGNFQSEKSGLESGIATLEQQLEKKRTEYVTLEATIRELNKNITSIQPTIDEINRLLKSYGFFNFRIVPSTEEGFYQIQRENGLIAEHTLSEGEVTFITFLYYLQLAKGGLSKETISEDRILVIDDPISSLDSNVLFVVSTLVKGLIKDVKSEVGNIKQIILLTHNVYFHKEVSYEGLRPGKGEKPNFWMLRKNNRKSTLHPYGEKNPIQSSYELLWREVKEWRNNSGVTIQNTLRRIVEHYFSILGSKREEILIDKFPNPEEKDICRSLLSWVNEGSHTLPDDLYVEAPHDVISKYLEVFKGIFIYTNNVGHYNMMMGIETEVE